MNWFVNFGFVALCLVYTGIFLVRLRLRRSVAQALVPGSKQARFAHFQRSYLFVYLMAFFADWIKGPYLFALYESYGYSRYEISVLFASGYLSSMVFGTVVGAMADNFGRKRLCVGFALCYMGSAVCKMFANFPMLLAGSLCSGIATSLLFCSFEAWMVTEHERKGFSSQLLSSTFSLASIGNGVGGILAGFTADLSAYQFGFRGPFVFALVPLCIVAYTVSTTWSENYGDRSLGTMQSLQNGLRTLRRSPELAWLGLAQASFEAGLHIFVFIWTPSIATEANKQTLPYGIMFSSFMTCVCIGTEFFRILTERQTDTMRIPYLVHGAAIAAMAIPILFYDNKLVVYCSFLLFEASCGVFYPCYATLRSRFLEGETRASIMNFFRVPLNALVIVLLVLSSAMDPSTTFCVCLALNVMSLWAFIRCKTRLSFGPLPDKATKE